MTTHIITSNDLLIATTISSQMVKPAIEQYAEELHENPKVTLIDSKGNEGHFAAKVEYYAVEGKGTKETIIVTAFENLAKATAAITAKIEAGELDADGRNLQSCDIEF